MTRGPRLLVPFPEAPRPLIFNAPTLAALLLAVVETALGIFVLATAVRCAAAAGARARPRTAFAGPGAGSSSAPFESQFKTALESPFAATVLLPTAVLATAAAVSVPLLYAVLASYVPQWDGAVCVAGVIRIGRDSLGPAGALPTLLGVAAASRLAALFAAGAWLALHAADRRTTTGALARATGAAATVLAVAAFVGGAAEASYLLIEKREQHLFIGCCTTSGLGAGTQAPAWASAPASVSAAVLVVASLVALRASRSAGRAPWFAVSVPVATVSGAALFAGPIAAAAGGSASHACVHCAVTGSPLATLGVALLAAAAAAAAWAAVVRIAARGSASEAAGGPGDVTAALGISRSLSRFAGVALPVAAAVLCAALFLVSANGRTP